MRLLGRRSADERSVSLIVGVPADRYDAELLDALTDALPAALRHRRRGDADGPGRGRVGARARHRPRAPTGIPELPVAELEQEVVALARTWDDALRERLVEPPARPAGASSRAPLGAALPALLQGLASPRRSPWPTSTASTGWSASGLPVPRRAPERAEPDARRALQDGREGRAGRRDADARAPRPAGDRGGPDPPARRRRRHLGAGLRRARPGRPPARPRGGRRRAWPTASRPSGAATPSPTR